MRILLAPENQSAEKVIECLLGWSRSGLLEPFAWRSTKPGEVPGSSTQVSRVEAGETRELLLGAALQGFDKSNDELIAFYPATPEEGFEPNFANAAVACIDLLAQTIAHEATHPARCTMVVAPSQIGQVVPCTLLSQSFASNVYIAPEDRAEPRDPNRLLGNEDVFPMHAAHAIATVADLWNEPDTSRPSVVDVLAKRQPHNQLATQVIRCYSRGIDFGYLPDHVSAGIFHGSGGWPNPNPERLDRIDDTNTVIPHVVDDFMKMFRQELGLSDFEPHRLRDPEPLGLLEAFRLLIRLIVLRIRRKPFKVVRQRLDSIYNAAADWVEEQAGPDSGIRVKRRGGPKETADNGIDLDEALGKPLVVPDGPVNEAWTALRHLVLGLVDGSDLPDGIEQVRLVNGKGQRALVTEPAALVPDPASDPPPIDDADGRICDPRRLDPTVAGEGSSISVPEALIEWSQPHRPALVWKIGLRIASALSTAHREAQTAVDPEADESDEAEEAAREQPNGDDERQGLRKRLRQVILISTAIAVLAALVAISQFALIGVAVALTAIFALWFLALASAARRWFLADEQIDRREAEQEIAQLNAARKRSLRMGDEIRLERRYREYLDWAELLGWLVHKPWVGDALDRVTLSPPVDHATLPAAFGIGIAEISEYGLERLSAAAGAGVFSPGWLTGLYETTERLEMTEIGIRRGLPSEDAEASRPDPTTDVGKDREGPRGRLLDAVRRGKYRSLIGSGLGDEVLRYLGDLKPDQVCERVAVLPTADGATVGEEIDALPPSLAGFQPPASLPRLVAELSPAVVRIECKARYRDFGGTGVVVSEEGLVATALEVVDGAESISVRTSTREEFKAQLKRTDPDTKLALLSLEAGGERPAVPLPEPVTIFQGDPVIGIGRPFTAQELPTVIWGLVTASTLSIKAPSSRPPGVPIIQVAYHCAEGAPGAPLFSLDGELLGIHYSASPDELSDLRRQRISNAIPIEALRELIDGGDEPSVDRHSRGRMRAARHGSSVTQPATFIEELTHVEVAPSLLPHHWKDAEAKNGTKESIPPITEAAGGTEKFSSLATNLAFLTPLRILVHRVDLVAPSSVRDLKSFPDADSHDLGPDEEVGSEFA